jgi:hypothetical protein
MCVIIRMNHLRNATIFHIKSLLSADQLFTIMIPRISKNGLHNFFSCIDVNNVYLKVHCIILILSIIFVKPLFDSLYQDRMKWNHKCEFKVDMSEKLHNGDISGCHIVITHSQSQRLRFVIGCPRGILWQIAECNEY